MIGYWAGRLRELRDPQAGGDKLKDELKQLVRSRLAPYEVPREVEFVSELPRTVTGKIQRSVLRAAQVKKGA